ncbi:hypothetical protein BD410DRAFT_635760 [Rickenella mellea]|uniref:F-box domain-containing protein n=1 Tax=Rickenella mellea TaxID=50990 RepID=A0A4Y7QD43_9AGAM|nr:hypothetical protein BD410DRAFT_635760 [Rickenella mellea]
MVGSVGRIVATSLDAATACDAPIKRLSFETLSQMFLECLPVAGLPSVSTADAPVLLGRVCSHWRTVALSTPQLWAGLGLGNRTPSDYTKDAIAAAEWKRRAGLCDLSYSLWLTPDRVVNVILRHRSQWRHIEAHIEPDGWKRVYLAISQGAPRLLYLRVEIESPLQRFVGGYVHPLPIDIDIPIHGAMRLEHLHVKKNCRLHFAQVEAPFLRELIFETATLTFDECWSCLTYCPNLEYFRARCSTAHPLSLGSETMEAKNLKHLQLDVFHVDQTELGPFLELICTPSLESLKIYFFMSDDDDGIGFPQVPRFLEQSGAHLVDMHISGPMTQDQTIECLHHTPALTSLELRSRLLNDAVMKALTIGPGQAISHNSMCAELQKIILAQVGSCASLMSSDVVKDMILSRWGGEHGQMMLSNGVLDNIRKGKLRTIVLDGFEFRDGLAIAKEQSIAKCIEEGLFIVEYAPMRFDGESSSYESDESQSGSSQSE